MTNEFRAMCAELLAALESEGYAHWSTTPGEDELCLRARALLAQPEPVAPTDEELDELFTEIDQGGEALSWRPYARAVLAKWGANAQ